MLKSIVMSGKKLFPIIEGGKGVGVSDGGSAGAFAAAGAIGTISITGSKLILDDGSISDQYVYKSNTRKGRFKECVENSINASISQIKKAAKIAAGRGAIHLNILWELNAPQVVLTSVLEKTSHLVDGITCGAGMPFQLSEIAKKFKVFYYPIVSSKRAFQMLWKRSYHQTPDLLGGVVYEDPWLAGGHNGITNKEDPFTPLDPFPRLQEIRHFMNEVGLENTPIIMAGGVWYTKDWEAKMEEYGIGPVAYQFGTRPLLTKESPISMAWKRKLTKLKKEDVIMHKFSPTGFYSSAIKNDFIQKLLDRSDRQVGFSRNKTDDFNTEMPLSNIRNRKFYCNDVDIERIKGWFANGFTKHMITPDETMVFVTEKEGDNILKDQIGCMGCLHNCKFSNWRSYGEFTTGRKPDPRSFCIHKTLHNVIYKDDVDNELTFCGKNGYMFTKDPLFRNSVKLFLKMIYHPSKNW